LECAVAGRSEIVVTGDLDLLALRNFRGIKIVSVSDFLAQNRVR
jgi:predicted nucleic acid-binding protein